MKRPTHKSMLPVAIYARVSTDDQNCEMQLTELRGYAERQGWQVIEYIEKASGKAGSKRPVLEKLMADARMKRFTAVLVWKLDRFGRSVVDFTTRLLELDQAGIRFVAPNQGIDTDHRSPAGRLLMHILSAIAEFERELIRERVAAGMAEHKRIVAAGQLGKTRHTRSGKDLPAGRPRKLFRRDLAASLRDQGLSWRQIARRLNVPQSTIRLALGARS